MILWTVKQAKINELINKSHLLYKITSLGATRCPLVINSNRTLI